jgi:hypothetical protein
MSKTEMISELPKLSHEERREIMRLIFQMEQDSATLAECDRLALERFQMLDALETKDGRNTGLGTR